MLSILIVDDNPEKIKLIREIIVSLSISEDFIDYASCIIEAKRKLLTKKFDIMLLDIMLPLRIGDDPSQDSGVELLSEITATDKYLMPNHIIGITAYREVYAKYNSSFDENLIALLIYDRSSEEWKERIKKLIFQVKKAKLSGEQIIADYDYDIAVVCALDDPELKYILKLGFDWEAHSILCDCANYYSGNVKIKGVTRKIVCASAGEMGMSASAVLATKIINHFRPRLLAMTGIAAGVRNKEMNYGDILVADPSFDYGSGKNVLEDETLVFKPDYRQLRLDADVIQIFRLLSSNRKLLSDIRDTCECEVPDTILKIHIGNIGSGSAVIANTKVIDEIKKHCRNLIGIDMEIYGVMLAAKQSIKPQPKVLCIKSVCDFADEKKNDRYQSYAAYTSASLLKEFINLYF
jgi:nucleoside phosphorylase/CheY-like chemotaxis protein